MNSIFAVGDFCTINNSCKRYRIWKMDGDLAHLETPRGPSGKRPSDGVVHVNHLRRADAPGGDGAGDGGEDGRRGDVVRALSRCDNASRWFEARDTAMNRNELRRAYRVAFRSLVGSYPTDVELEQMIGI